MVSLPGRRLTLARVDAPSQEASVVKHFHGTAFAGLILAMAMSGEAAAKPTLVASTPDANAVVTERPMQVDLQFSEKVRVITVLVSGPGGRRVTATVGVDQNDTSQVFVSFWDTLRPGTYSVQWNVLSADNQRADGSYSFTVKAS